MSECSRCLGHGFLTKQTYAGPEIYQCHVCGGSGILNEYTPWLELGITEVAYWKRRYLKARTKLYALQLKLKDLIEDTI